MLTRDLMISAPSFNRVTLNIHNLYIMPTTKSGHLPLAQYASKQGVLTCLLISSFCLLPRSKWPYAPATDRAPLDRPEWPFLTPITANPVRSMLYDVLGVSFCMLWWAPTLRAWWSPERLADRDARVRQTLNVSSKRRHWSTSADNPVALLGGDFDDSCIESHLYSSNLHIGR